MTSRSQATFRPHVRPTGRRRRLRREVRVAGYTLMMAMPLILGLLAIGGIRPSAAPASARMLGRTHGLVRSEQAPAARVPAISISIEPNTLAPVVDAEPPVVFPGYLLPDDDNEETAHAGS